MTAEIVSRTRLDSDETSAVLTLLRTVTESDGVAPTSEHVLLHMRHGGDREALNYLVYDGPSLVGYAHLDVTDRVEGPAAELAVRPDHRRQGIATGLLSVLERASEQAGHGGRMRLWAHGGLPEAGAMAKARGYVEARVLWQMRRSLLAPLPDRAVPPGVRLRPFVVGADEPAWLAVNNRAFVSHPDQGNWTLDSIRTREKEPWFDPAGFLLAEREADGALLGFHWTKVHGGDAGTAAGTGPHPHEPIGEVYVVGVDPDAQGTGLGAALTVAGLCYLRSLGLSQVMLYVDESNQPAMRTYERLGFTRWSVDMGYRRHVD